MSQSSFPGVPRILKSTTGLTCRVHERQACQLPSSCQPTSAWGRRDARWRATIHDISVSGVSILVARRFEPGIGLAVELPGTEGKDAYVVLAKVVRATQMKDGSWLLGCAFISELSDDEVERLLAPLCDHLSSSDDQTPAPVTPSRLAETPAPARPTRKAANRVLRDVQLHLETRPGVFVRALVRQLEVPERWPLPATRQLTLWGDPVNGPRPLFRVTVVRCVQQTERWQVQCRLVDPINADLLAAIGHFTGKP